MRRRSLAALVLAAALAGCGGDASSETKAPQEAPPLAASRGVLLISLDTLRADHLGTYGYERPTSPFLDRLAEERAVVFEQAWVQFPSTLTSHMSIFTGLYPAEHGVYPPNAVLADGVDTLPQVFQRAFFHTAGFTEGGFMHGRFGFRRGFDVFQARDRKGSDDTERTFERGLRFLRDLEDGEPFFLFLHTYAVHAPYDPPERLRRLFWEGPVPPGAFEPTGDALRRHNQSGDRLDDDVRAYFEALYDAGIRELDEILAAFFEELDTLGLLETTTIVITSDHGEELQDHGRMNHTQLYREVLRVPLLVMHPGLAAGRRSATVESIDLAPTLYELAGVEVPSGELSGRSLLPLLRGASPAAPEMAYAELEGGRWSLVGGDGEGLLHLLVDDPPDDEGWVTRRLQADVRGGEVRFEIRSFEEPRRVEVRDAGTVVDVIEAIPSWQPVELRLDGSARRTLVLESPDCTMTSKGKAPRCLSFQVRGLSRSRAELYDVDDDPAEVRNLAFRRADAVRALYKELHELRERGGGDAATQALDEELRRQLEALGYLD